ncbi:fungal-specific transcription factor domain-containing protein [Aspergillus pseudonomiae]|uniref:Fungal-specific transcription factor domain-containing protein n=1 Tax=Aspergillus pseudonomiae TaxID=1506151 RepID=A0A5N7DB12_9EURO|nr:fungal-specific transcription factor domain-containing protein [Aspergillus pseudonomiae]KAE8403223.1 fungal-specific transcription factor domain-containing protein [Aspergillus pseudonomiae]
MRAMRKDLNRNNAVTGMPPVPAALPIDALEHPDHAVVACAARRARVLTFSRKKKCDEIHPRCSDCRRLNLPCQWKASPSSPSSSHPSLPPSSESNLSLATPDPISPSDDAVDDPIGSSFPWLAVEEIIVPVASPCGSANPYLHNDEERSLFNHYLHIVARSLSRSGDPGGNPFLSILLPMAASSDTVTSVILGLSGCHWKRVYPGIWNRALARQGKDGQSTLEACTTVLLLCLTELCDGSSHAWEWHLKAASALLASVGDSSLESTLEGRFCLQLFRYLDSMSTISRCKPPLLREDAKLTDLTANQSICSLSSAPVDAVSGMVPALLELLGMVNLLAAHRSRRVDELSELGFRTAASHVRSQLDSWRAEYDSAAGTDYETDQVTTAFEWAVRLRLHQVVDGYDPHHEMVETAVSPILNAVMTIPYGSPVEGCLLFPLVIAGASSTDVERQMLVKERLMVMENTLGFGHISHARQLLETVWADEADCNWARVRYSLFPGMVFV